MNQVMTPEEMLAKIQAMPTLVKPPKEAKANTMPYYKEPYAMFLRDVIFSKLKKGEAVSYKDTAGRGPNTVSNLLSQARKYLFDKLDPTGEYKAIWKNTRTDVNIKGVYTFSPKSVGMSITENPSANVKSEVFKFLAGIGELGVGKATLSRENVIMSNDERAEIEAMLEQYKSILTYSIGIDYVHIINIPTEEIPT